MTFTKRVIKTMSKLHILYKNDKIVNVSFPGSHPLSLHVKQQPGHSFVFHAYKGLRQSKTDLFNIKCRPQLQTICQDKV